MISRIIGFFYRIFLSHTIGAEQLGIFQLVSPVYSMALSVCSAGIQTSLSRYIAAKTAEKDKTSALHFLVTGTVFSFTLSMLAALILYFFAVPLGEGFLGEPRTVPLLQVLAFSLPLSVTTFLHCRMVLRTEQDRNSFPVSASGTDRAVLASYVIYMIFLSEGRTPSALLAVLGTWPGIWFPASSR